MRAVAIHTSAVVALGALMGLTGCPPGPTGSGKPAADAAIAASRPAVDDEEAAAVNDWKPQPAPPASGMVAAGDQQKKFEGLADAYFASHPTKRLYIQVDKPMYQPGETIWLRTAAVNSATLTGAAGTVGALYQLISPKGAVVLQKRVQQHSGAASNDFELPADVQGGEYTIKVVTDDGANEERPVVVSAYEPPRYKKKLDFIRKAYGPGDTVGATVEVKLPTGEPFAGKDLTAVLTLDGSELPRAKFKTDDKGATVVRVPLPAQIERGDGLLTVLVEEAGVTESVSKSVPIVLNKLQLAFYPEGGDLVTGLPSRVYFAAQNMIGKPADIEGRVVDDQGQTAANLRSYHDGMGRFDLMPATGRSYQVEISKPVGVVERYALPVAQPDGCTLRTYDDPKGLEPAIRVAVHCTQARSVVLSAMVREQRLGSATAEVKPGQPAIVHLPLTRPAMQGVARVTLFSDGLEPLAERLVYRGWHKDLQVKITPDKTSYAPRDKVTLTVETRDLAGEPIPAELAMGIVDDTVISFADDKTAHLLAHMFLEKEVQGKIEEPNFYYKTDKNKAPLGLDMLLGTRGWRK
ncbi:MAG: hypothetical protein JXR83_08810, partial [Deltaproteobacteria bacterium]|nr:hypothetical protein [Deltaproteobacteria bacterium]